MTEQTKLWYQSGTIRSIVMALGFVVTLIWHKDIPVDDITSLVCAAGALVASAWAIWKRITATTKIG